MRPLNEPLFAEDFDAPEELQAELPRSFRTRVITIGAAFVIAAFGIGISLLGDR